MVKLRIAALLLLAALAGCGGDARPEPGGPPRTPVALTLTASRTGNALAATLSADSAETLHQLSCRVAYDPAALRYEGAEPGSLISAEAVFFTTTKAKDYAPVAFTYRTGDSAPAHSGTLAALRFTVLDPGGDLTLRLIREPELLIARDSARRDLALKLREQP